MFPYNLAAMYIPKPTTATTNAIKLTTAEEIFKHVLPLQQSPLS